MTASSSCAAALMPTASSTLWQPGRSGCLQQFCRFTAAGATDSWKVPQLPRLTQRALPQPLAVSQSPRHCSIVVLVLLELALGGPRHPLPTAVVGCRRHLALPLHKAEHAPGCLLFPRFLGWRWARGWVGGWAGEGGGGGWGSSGVTMCNAPVDRCQRSRLGGYMPTAQWL